MGEVIGYARVSSSGQSLEVQEEQLKAAGCTRIFAEKRSGKADDREQLSAALAWAREGDTLVVTRLDRLARSNLHLLQIVKGLNDKGVGFRCLQQGAIDTTKPEGRLMLGVLASVAEFETDLRKDRQMEGIAKARAEGRPTGRPRSVPVEEVRRLAAEEGLNPYQIQKRLGIGRGSVYRALAESD